ncbi:uncharacterized protein LOC122526871 [Frieseomelitta varia]|uniref:uncharacterized protein LOC122526871 n=1 Tax=Frieseomelitta varia TaxID=561572 RepID=UPI001CB68D63|nr:uncharacterized protein LOC122526871 [Frieseomelitta varia]
MFRLTRCRKYVVDFRSGAREWRSRWTERGNNRDQPAVTEVFVVPFWKKKFVTRYLRPRKDTRDMIHARRWTTALIESVVPRDMASGLIDHCSGSSKTLCPSFVFCAVV